MQALAALLEDEPRRQALGAAARELAEEEYSWDKIARRLLGIYELVTGRVGARVRYLPRNHWTQGLIAVAFCALVGVMLWWRGPDWGSCWTRSEAVTWRWVSRPRAQPPVARARARVACGLRQAVPPLPFMHIFSAFAVGLLGNAVLAARASSRASPSCGGLERGRGYTATLFGTVFTHRLFDVVPAMLLVVYVLLTAKIPTGR